MGHLIYLRFYNRVVLMRPFSFSKPVPKSIRLPSARPWMAEHASKPPETSYHEPLSTSLEPNNLEARGNQPPQEAEMRFGEHDREEDKREARQQAAGQHLPGHDHGEEHARGRLERKQQRPR